MASKLVEAGGRASVIKSEKWTKSLDFYIITHVLKSEAGNFVTFNQGYYLYSVTSFSATSLSANLGLVWLGFSSEKPHLLLF